MAIRIFASVSSQKSASDAVFGAFSDDLYKILKPKTGGAKSVTVKPRKLFAKDSLELEIIFEASDKSRFDEELKNISPEGETADPSVSLSAYFFNCAVIAKTDSADAFKRELDLIRDKLRGFSPGGDAPLPLICGGEELIGYGARPTDEGIERQGRTSEALANAGLSDEAQISMIMALPPLPDALSVMRLSSEAVAKRAVALSVIAMYAYSVSAGKSADESREQALKTLEIFGAGDDVVEEHKRFFYATIPDLSAAIKLMRITEAARVLLWSLGLAEIDELPTEASDPDAVFNELGRAENLEELLEPAQELPMRKIIDLADKTYRISVLCAYARLKGQPMPFGVNSDIIAQRDGAFRFLLGADSVGAAQ